MYFTTAGCWLLIDSIVVKQTAAEKEEGREKKCEKNGSSTDINTKSFYL
jgi:hypothetical protein